jgi:hypothetical protein
MINAKAAGVSLVPFVAAGVMAVVGPMATSPAGDAVGRVSAVLLTPSSYTHAADVGCQPVMFMVGYGSQRPIGLCSMKGDTSYMAM